MRKLRNLALLAIVAGFLGLGAQFYRSWYYNQQEKAEIHGLKTRWGAGRFVDIQEHREHLPGLLSSAIRKCDTNGVLSSATSAALAVRVALMLEAFSTGDENAYRAFHFPVDTKRFGQLNPGRMAILRKAMLSEGVSGADTLSDEDAFVRWGSRLASLPPYDICHTCWRDVNLDDVLFTFVLASRTNSVSLHDVARKFEPLRSTSVFESIVAYYPTYNELLITGQEVLFAFVRIPIRMKKGEIGVYPVFAGLYWSEAHQAWIADQLALPSAETELRIWF
jgi:hypothetical protein